LVHSLSITIIGGRAGRPRHDHRVYPGDVGYATSTGTLTQTIAQAPTALTARIRLSPRLAVILTARLTASGRPLSGQPASFSTEHTHLCTPRTSTHGVATCVLTVPQICLVEPDNGPIRASYPGSADYRPSSATATATC
jgi:hypothetical protein